MEFFLKLLFLGRGYVHVRPLGHIDDHMPAPDGSCGMQTHDPWDQRHGPLRTGPSVRTCFFIIFLKWFILGSSGLTWTY